MSRKFKLHWNPIKMTCSLHEDQWTFFYRISFISSYNEKCFIKRCSRHQNTHFVSNKIFPKSVPLWDNIQKYGRARLLTNDIYIIWQMRFVILKNLLNFNINFNNYCHKFWGTGVAQWLRCCATNRKVAGSIPDGIIGVFHWHNPSNHTMALGSTQPLTEMSTRRISWG